MNENEVIFERYMKKKEGDGSKMPHKDKVKGGLGDGTSHQDIADRHGVSKEEIDKQMEMGVKVEMEHTNDKDIAMEIAHDHLFEFPDYYTALEEMEERLKKKWKKK